MTSALSYIKAKIEELEALEKAASPGPWKYDCGNWQVENEINRNSICNWVGWDDWEEFDKKRKEDPFYTYEFIAKSRNAFPGILEALKHLLEYQDFYSESFAKKHLEKAARAMGWKWE